MEPEHVAGIVKALTKAQTDWLIGCARFLDAAAGEGVGFEVEYEDGTRANAFADDLVFAAVDLFGLPELTDSVDAFSIAVRSAQGD